MSKYILFALVIFTSISNLNAQDQLSKRLSLGVEVGPNLSIFYGESDPYYQTSPAIGFSGGLTFQVVINKLLSFRTCYSFQQKVEKPKYNNHFIDVPMISSGSAREHSNFYYLNIPILLQFNFGKRVGFFTNIGPNIGFLLKGEQITETSDNPSKTSTPPTNKFDFGLTAGVGMAVQIKDRFSLTFEVRNNLSFKPLYVYYQESKIYTIDFLIGFSIYNP